MGAASVSIELAKESTLRGGLFCITAFPVRRRGTSGATELLLSLKSVAELPAIWITLLRCLWLDCVVQECVSGYRCCRQSCPLHDLQDAMARFLHLGCVHLLNLSLAGVAPWVVGRLCSCCTSLSLQLCSSGPACSAQNQCEHRSQRNGRKSFCLQKVQCFPMYSKSMTVSLVCRWVLRAFCFFT